MSINESECKGNLCFFQQSSSSKKFCSFQLPQSSSQQAFFSDLNTEIKSEYRPCEYVSNRTRIRCPNFRKKEELCQKGFCEKHAGFIERIHVEGLRSRALLDPGFSKDGTNKLFLSDNLDETMDFFELPFVIESLYCDDRIDDSYNPLRNAAIFTRKEAIHEYIQALERQKLAISDLRGIFADKHQRLLVERHQKKAQTKKKTFLTKKSRENASEAEKKKFLELEADKKYGSYAKWRRTQGLVSRALKQLIQINKEADLLEPSTSENGPFIRSKNYFKNSEKNAEDTGCQFLIKKNLGKPKILPYKMDISHETSLKDADLIDFEIVRLVLNEVVDYVSISLTPLEDIIETSFCSKRRIPFTDFCLGHVTKEISQNLFSKCTECEGTAHPLNNLFKCRQHSVPLYNNPYLHHNYFHSQQLIQNSSTPFITNKLTKNISLASTSSLDLDTHNNGFLYPSIPISNGSQKSTTPSPNVSKLYPLNGSTNSQKSININNNFLKGYGMTETAPVKAYRGRQPRQPKPTGFGLFPTKEIFGNMNNYGQKNIISNIRKAQLEAGAALINLSNGQMPLNEAHLSEKHSMTAISDDIQPFTSNIDKPYILEQEKITSIKYVSIEEDLESQSFIENILEHKRAQSELQRTHPRKSNPALGGINFNGNQRTSLNTNFLLQSNNQRQINGLNNNINGTNLNEVETTVIYADNNNIANSQTGRLSLDSTHTYALPSNRKQNQRQIIGSAAQQQSIMGRNEYKQTITTKQQTPYNLVPVIKKNNDSCARVRPFVPGPKNGSNKNSTLTNFKSQNNNVIPPHHNYYQQTPLPGQSVTRRVQFQYAATTPTIPLTNAVAISATSTPSSSSRPISFSTAQQSPQIWQSSPYGGGNGNLIHQQQYTPHHALNGQPLQKIPRRVNPSTPLQQPMLINGNTGSVPMVGQYIHTNGMAQSNQFPRAFAKPQQGPPQVMRTIFVRRKY